MQIDNLFVLKYWNWKLTSNYLYHICWILLYTYFHFNGNIVNYFDLCLKWCIHLKQPCYLFIVNRLLVLSSIIMLVYRHGRHVNFRGLYKILADAATVLDIVDAVWRERCVENCWLRLSCKYGGMVFRAFTGTLTVTCQYRSWRINRHLLA